MLQGFTPKPPGHATGEPPSAENRHTALQLDWEIDELVKHEDDISQG